MKLTMVVATFKPGTNREEVFLVVREEVAQVERLRAEKRMGTVHISMPRETVFIEVFSDSEESVRETIATLPMAKWWDIDLFPVTLPPTERGEPT